MTRHICKTFVFAIIIATICALSLFTSCFAESQAGWLSGWSTRRPIILHNYSNSELLDYQVEVVNPIRQEGGLLAGWHFEGAEGGLTFDGSGRGKNAVVRGARLVEGKFGKGLNFNGTSDYIDAGEIGLVKRIEFYINAANPNDGVMELNPAVSISILSGKITVSGVNSAAVYVNAKKGDELSAGFNHVVITTDTAIDASAVKIGVVKSDYFQGVIDEVLFYDWHLRDADVAWYYLKKARSDYNDIRFTDSDGTTLLKYYLEKDGNLWVKVPRLEKGTNHLIYMYYGNDKAGSLSDGRAVFDFFEDFQGQDIGQWKNDGWDISNQTPAGGGLCPRTKYSALTKTRNAKLERTLTLPSANMRIEIYAAINGDLLQNYLIFYEDNKKKIIWDETGGWVKKGIGLSSAKPGIKFLLKTDGEHIGGIDTIFVRKYVEPGVSVDLYGESSR